MTTNRFIYDFSIDNYKGFEGRFFYQVLDKIIEIGNLRERNHLRVLDFGCGLKKLKPYISNYIGYDIDSRFTEVDDWRKAEFDAVIANAVFMYMTKEELERFVVQLHQHNPNVELIFGATRMNIITKTYKLLTGKIQGYADVKLTYKEQLRILLKYFDVIGKTALLGLNNVHFMKFKK